jgi:poly-gamma-glutamate capsule biosynthesis protein CapA/YwtB (metallophosphatase superfamily)
VPTSSRRPPRRSPRPPEERTTPTEHRAALLLAGFLALVGLGAAVAGTIDDGADTVAAVAGEAEAVAAGDEDAGADGTDEGAADALRSFTVAATGDILIHESVALKAGEYGGDGFDFRPMFELVAPALSGADLAICHLESPVSADNRDLAYYPAFRVPFQILDAVADAGYDGCSLASNHALDGGEPTVLATLAKAEAAGIETAGMASRAEDAQRLTLYDVAGVTVGQLSFTYGLNTGPLAAGQEHLTNIISQEAVLAAAARLRAAGAEFVIASLHWGTEYQNAPNELQSTLVEPLLASPDIDLILGHHAHVVQPIQQVGSEYAVLGLGNFLSNQSPESCSVCPPGTQDGVVLQLTVTETAPGTFAVTSIDPLPTWVDRTTYEIVPLDGTAEDGRDPEVLRTSRDRTLALLAQLGVPVS